MKRIALTLLFSFIFFGGAYLMGNYMLNTFDESVSDQIMGSLAGIICWMILVVVMLIPIGFYKIAKEITK